MTWILVKAFSRSLRRSSLLQMVLLKYLTIYIRSGYLTENGRNQVFRQHLYQLYDPSYILIQIGSTFSGPRKMEEN